MLALLIFAGLTLLVTAPLATYFIVRRPKGANRSTGLSIGSALIAFAALIGGLFSRSDEMASVLGAIETGAMLMAGIAIFDALVNPNDRHSHAPVLVAAVIEAALFALAMAAGWDDQSAAALLWSALTTIGFVHFLSASDRPALLDSPAAIVAAIVYLPVHVAQLAQVAAHGALAAAVPITTLIVLAILLAWTTYRQFARRQARYERSGLGADDAAKLFARIEQLMVADHPYRSLDFNRDALATLLDEAPRAIGEAVNRNAHMSFAAYVRLLRLEDSARMLGQERNRGVALEAIGMEAGFRSRSAFYAAFEDHFGTSPGEYRETALR